MEVPVKRDQLPRGRGKTVDRLTNDFNIPRRMVAKGSRIPACLYGLSSENSDMVGT